MPIPKLRKDGWLPVGVHDCTLEDIRKRFGSFTTSDHRVRLFEKLDELLNNAQITGLVIQYLRQKL